MCRLNLEMCTPSKLSMSASLCPYSASCMHRENFSVLRSQYLCWWKLNIFGLHNQGLAQAPSCLPLSSCKRQGRVLFYPLPFLWYLPVEAAWDVASSMFAHTVFRQSVIYRFPGLNCILTLLAGFKFCSF